METETDLLVAHADPADFPSLLPTLAWLAADLPDGPLATWEPSLNLTTNAGVNFTGGSGGTVQSGASNFGAVTAWVNSPGYNFSGNPNDSWQDGLGNPATQENASWELVFRPGDYVGKHTLFNTGGNGDGLAFTLTGSVLEFLFQDADSEDQRVRVSTDLALIGPATDLDIEAKEILRLRARLYDILANHTGQSTEKVEKDCDRNLWLDAAEAIEYGLADRILQKAPEIVRDQEPEPEQK